MVAPGDDHEIAHAQLGSGVISTVSLTLASNIVVMVVEGG
jgi:hypothetical protein